MNELKPIIIWIQLTFNVVLTVGLIVTLIRSPSKRITTDILTVKRINVISENGKNALIIANEKRMPAPVINGKTYRRALLPAGILFFNKENQECGGLAFSGDKSSGLNALAFDYHNADAVGILAQDRYQKRGFRAGLIINDKDYSGRPGSNISRIKLMTVNGNAALTICDPDERPRLVLSVDSAGNPSIGIYDRTGRLRRRLTDL